MKAVGSATAQAVKEKMRDAMLNPKVWNSPFQERVTKRSGALAMKLGEG